MEVETDASGGTDAGDMLTKIMEITGTGREEAGHLLAACNNDLEAAVALFFEQGAPDLSSSPAANSAAPDLVNIIDDDADEDNVRAPIAPIRDRMVAPEEDHFFRESSPTNRRLMRAAPRVKVCPLRDFAREGEIMEQQLRAAASLDNATASSADVLGAAAASGSRENSLSSMRRNARMMATHFHSRSSRHGGMSALFRPPLELLFIGTFQMARARATAIKRWLLVNVQSQNFNSQVLNRDVWSNKEVRRLVQRQFVLYQLDADTSDGRRFITFYHCQQQPYLSIIDPRTGEEVWNSPEPNSANVLRNLRKFLRDHRDFALEMEDTTTTSSNDACVTLDDEEGEESACSSSAGLPAKRAKVVELSEEEQLALAIRNSLRENGDSQDSQQTNGDDENSNSSMGSSATSSSTNAISSNATSSGLDDFKFEEPSQNATEQINYEKHLGAKKDELTMLKLRLLNSEGIDETVQLRWPSDTKLQALRFYIAQFFKHMPQNGYKLICAFPRKQLETEHDGQTLKELSLHPSANIHLTLED